ncbi:hypothetical protein SH661x_003999 [Planctomicrobium sp. SH661]|uniref:hypothetical protein n=1 Tax=Planctomicrobium sp. SH661 TaxID=3448124 RepID=UPI003F5BF288
MMQFAPAILLSDSIVELPRPILICRVHDSWDFLKLKVPRQDGNRIAGPSRDGADITIEGQIGSQSGNVKLSEVTMLETVELLRSALHTSDDDGFSLALYRDGDSNFRYFRQCVTTRLEIDLSSQHLYSYALSIHAADPVLRSGLPA